MGYEVISKAGNGGLLDPMANNFIGCTSNENCETHNDNCKGCATGQGCNIDIPVNGSCGGGNKDFKCTLNGGCTACAMPRASRFTQY